MQAYNPDTVTSYSSLDALIEAEANGVAVVSILRHVQPKTGRITTFARTTGPFTDRTSARNKAASLRRKWKRLKHKPEGTSLLKVAVEPLWSDLRRDTDHD